MGCAQFGAQWLHAWQMVILPALQGLEGTPTCIREWAAGSGQNASSAVAMDASRSAARRRNEHGRVALVWRGELAKIQAQGKSRTA